MVLWLYQPYSEDKRVLVVISCYFLSRCPLDVLVYALDFSSPANPLKIVAGLYILLDHRINALSLRLAQI